MVWDLNGLAGRAWDAPRQSDRWHGPPVRAGVEKSSMKILARALVGLMGLVVAAAVPTFAGSRYGLLIRGGHVIDPKNGIDSVMDVAIAGGRIAAVAADIAPERATQVADARGLYMVPGLLDIHAHVFYGTESDAAYHNGTTAIPPDGFTFRSGVNDGRRCRRRWLAQLCSIQDPVIDRSRTRVLAFLNIVGSGMKGGPVEPNLADMDGRLTAAGARQFPALIVGVKTAHYSGPEWDPVDRAVEAGRLAGIPVMVDFGRFVEQRPFEELVTSRLRPGDIYTHTFLGNVPMLDANGELSPLSGGGAEARRDLRRRAWGRQFSFSRRCPPHGRDSRPIRSAPTSTR